MATRPFGDRNNVIEIDSRIRSEGMAAGDMKVHGKREEFPRNGRRGAIRLRGHCYRQSLERASNQLKLRAGAKAQKLMKRP